MTAPLLRVRGLTKKYGEVTVLEGVDLDVAPGRALALRGRNGAGKSTLLRCVTGADEPTSGTVELDGSPVDERSVRDRRDVAAVTDDLDFFPDLSVVEHLDLLARAHRVDDAEALVDEVLEEVRLVAQAAQLPGTLSSGQRRRLALASAFVRPRRLLVLDEPEARLDRPGLAWLVERLRREKADGLGILLASHDPDLVAAVADDVLDLDALGTPEPPVSSEP
ncbi:ABC transporter ATP-binding protein [Nocardioides sp. LMS-CY]|uniref:ABC transporter ATP-binding protein n=1 Tax=Nocardioides sp. (strain LMS-CY) TaxID=2840457 RepID=UPI001C0039E6|nr:ABC transporter ATP-binding protein [Nocardioides sp. LMS-CY]QWF22502.1 ABC transporter ATP-binding protein [Nocardioides sp. LMS-CY]